MPITNLWFKLWTIILRIVTDRRNKYNLFTVSFYNFDRRLELWFINLLLRLQRVSKAADKMSFKV